MPTERPGQKTADDRGGARHHRTVAGVWRGAHRTWIAIGMVAMFAVSIGAYVWSRLDRRPPASRADWVQLTRFSDSACTQPRVPGWSPAGVHSRRRTHSRPEANVYLKLLPSGEPSRADPRQPPEDGPGVLAGRELASHTPSPAPSRAGTLGPSRHSVENRTPGCVMLQDSRGSAPSEILFSEIKTNQGVHMGIVTSAETRLGSRNLYLPSDPGGMAHRSYRSPDGRWILIVEMDGPGNGSRVGWRPLTLRRRAGRSDRPMLAARVQDGRPMDDGCTSAPASVTLFISGGNGSPMARSNRRPPAPRRRRAWRSPRTGDRSSRPLASVNGRYGYMTEQASTRFPGKGTRTRRSCPQMARRPVI